MLKGILIVAVVLVLYFGYVKFKAWRDESRKDRFGFKP